MSRCTCEKRPGPPSSGCRMTLGLFLSCYGHGRSTGCREKDPLHHRSDRSISLSWFANALDNRLRAVRKRLSDLMMHFDDARIGPAPRWARGAIGQRPCFCLFGLPCRWLGPPDMHWLMFRCIAHLISMGGCERVCVWCRVGCGVVSRCARPRSHQNDFVMPSLMMYSAAIKNSPSGAMRAEKDRLRCVGIFSREKSECCAAPIWMTSAHSLRVRGFVVDGFRNERMPNASRISA